MLFRSPPIFLRFRAFIHFLVELFQSFSDHFESDFARSILGLFIELPASFGLESRIDLLRFEEQLRPDLEILAMSSDIFKLTSS